MKKILIVVGVVILAVIAIPIIGGVLSSLNPSKSIEMAKDKVTTSVSVKSYFNPSRGIKFSFPDGWTQDTRLTDGPKPIIGLFNKDTASVQLGHFSKTDSGYTNFADFKKGTLKQLSFAPAFNKISESDTEVNGMKVYKLVTTIEDQNKNTIKNMLYWYFPAEGDMYVSLTYSNKPENFDSLTKEFESIASSMDLQNK